MPARGWERPRRAAEWAAATGLASWAVGRALSVDRLRWAQPWAVPVFSFTPQAAAAAWATATLARGRGPRTVAGLAGVALTTAVTPRAVPRRRVAAGGTRLRVLTANLWLGRADAAAVVAAVRRTGADVLFLQEINDDALRRLKRAGLPSLLPACRSQSWADGGRGSALFARYELDDGPVVAPSSMAQPAGRLSLPSGQRVDLVCVHCRPPRPVGHAFGVDGWRNELAALPVPTATPGQIPVILAGDFNSTLDHAKFRALLRRGYADAACRAGGGLTPTWGPESSGRPPLLTIDHILVDPRCTVWSSAVFRLPGSDHRLLFADVELPR